ncbi:threonine synthase [Longimicrobium sp.]|jgi:threonine synthase|uniref:threonine synthase n=1 Tax=Longimicrobium sp. TaxID=2029185 RepID=UPI002EDA7E1D
MTDPSNTGISGANTTFGGATHLECTRCGAMYESEVLHRLSPCCEKPLYPRYALDLIGGRLRRGDLAGRSADLWRYAELLPVRDPANAVRLGEGFTPMIDAPRLASRLGVAQCWVKDEGQNPTASFKARGLCMAISRAKELGVTEVGIPSAGNAGSATAAYAAAAGMTAHVVVPNDTPHPIIEEMRALGADVELLAGLITDCAARVAEGTRDHGWFDLSTLKEPYRVEGKKTMGYEVAEQLGWTLPDVIVYPTGGGTGLVGMWKAFDEMERLGWIGPERPRMVCVQAEGCAPMVRAFEQGTEYAEPWVDAHTYASGLRVPRAVGDFLILDALRSSGGAALAVSDDEMREWTRIVGADTGVFCAPEGAATAVATARLRQLGAIRPDDRVVLFNTGSGLKYVV